MADRDELKALFKEVMANNNYVANLGNAHVFELPQELFERIQAAVDNERAPIQPVAAQEDAGKVPAGWAYEFHDFSDVWKRHAILNRHAGGGNAPTKHNGSEIRNVRPFYFVSQPSNVAPTIELCAACSDIVARPMPAATVPQVVQELSDSDIVQLAIKHDHGGGLNAEFTEAELIAFSRELLTLADNPNQRT